jgi:glycosyltransferase involved in cell wall biosynthesis
MLMKNEDLRKEMGEKARRSVAKYDIDIVGQQWKQLFDELMQKNGV